MTTSVLGYGLLGKAIVNRLRDLSYDVSVYSPSRINEEGFCSDPDSAARSSDIILDVTSDFTSVKSNVQAVKDLRDKLYVQISTLSPDQSIEISKAVSEKRGVFIECPVLGSRPEAAKGKLIGMVGPEADLSEECMELLSQFCGSVYRFKNTGEASTAKLCLNFLIGSLTISFSTTLQSLIRSGIEIEQFMQILRESAVYAPTFDKKLAKMLSSQFDNPNFPTAHLAKDMSLFSNMQPNGTFASEYSTDLAHFVLGVAEKQTEKLDYSSIYREICKKYDD